MDIFTTIVQTTKLHGISAYLRDRIKRRFELPSLADAIEAAGQSYGNRLASGCEDTAALINKISDRPRHVADRPGRIYDLVPSPWQPVSGYHGANKKKNHE